MTKFAGFSVRWSKSSIENIIIKKKCCYKIRKTGENEAKSGGSVGTVGKSVIVETLKLCYKFCSKTDIDHRILQIMLGLLFLVEKASTRGALCKGPGSSQESLAFTIGESFASLWFCSIMLNKNTIWYPKWLQTPLQTWPWTKLSRFPHTLFLNDNRRQ